jgi:hypothetical protein
VGASLFDKLPAFGDEIFIPGGSKNEAYGQIGFLHRPNTELLRLSPKECFRDLGQNTCAIPGFSIGIQGTPMGEAAKRFQRIFHDPVLLPTRYIGNETNTASIVFIFRSV